MGLEIRVRKSGLGLLGWKVGCNYDHFENSPTVGRWAKNHQIFRVDALGCVA